MQAELDGFSITPLRTILSQSMAFETNLLEKTRLMSLFLNKMHAFHLHKKHKQRDIIRIESNRDCQQQ